MSFFRRLFGAKVFPQTTIITNKNIGNLVGQHYNDKKSLPEDLQNIPIGKWDVSKVTNMRRLFYGQSDFKEPLNDWNVSNVETMESMFYGCEKFKEPLDKWDVSKVKNMSYMFFNCKIFNQPLNNWNVSSVGTNDKRELYEGMSNMFYGCKRFNQPLNNWDVSNVKDMRYMFFLCKDFNIENIKNWEVNPITDMSDMLGNTKYDDGDVKRFYPKKRIVAEPIVAEPIVTKPENNVLDQSLAIRTENNVIGKSLITKPENNVLGESLVTEIKNNINQSIPNQQPILEIGKEYRIIEGPHIGNYLGQQPNGNGGYIHIFKNGERVTKISNTYLVEEYFNFKKGKYYEITKPNGEKNIYKYIKHMPLGGQNYSYYDVFETIGKDGRTKEFEMSDPKKYIIKEIEGGGGYAGGRKSRKNINKKRKSRKRKEKK